MRYILILSLLFCYGCKTDTVEASPSEIPETTAMQVEETTSDATASTATTESADTVSEEIITPQNPLNTEEDKEITDAQKLSGYLDKLTSYEANFVQQRYSASRDVMDSSSGRFVLSRPNQFIWQTFTPFEQKIISNGEVLWTVDIDLEQVIINDVDERIENAPIYLLARNQADITNLFEVTLQKVEQKSEYFVLQPKDESAAFEGVRIGFTEGILSSIELGDSLGQLTMVTMTNIRNNPVLDITQFDYTPEEDFDIIDSRTMNSDSENP